MTENGGDLFIEATGVPSTFDRGINSLSYREIHIFIVLFVQEVIHDPLNQILRELTMLAIASKSNISPLIAFVKRGNHSLKN